MTSNKILLPAVVWHHFGGGSAMSTSSLILAGSWTPYNEYKLSMGLDPHMFLPNDPFEVNFLVNRIILHNPDYSKEDVQSSIFQVRRRLFAGCQRPLFVELVMARLMQCEPQLAE